MADLVFRNTPYGTVTIFESWPLWQKKVWLDVLGVPQPPAYVPTFEPVHFVTDGPTGISVPLNPELFATEETALEMVKRFGADRVASVKYQGSGGGESSTARERWIVFRDGTALNAGDLAVNFKQNPDDLYPNVAHNACLADIDSARKDGQKLPKE